MTPPPERRYAVGAHFALPLSIAAVVLGLAPLAILYLNATRLALAALTLVLVLVLAILRAMLFPGDR
ncbi:hypothetical protein GCM10022253_28220 [Sphingomonas endophytica]|uniref:Uncharacterized protein n=1 Tax=Sphingomonas endophytica TaxID=869719 RepID=A0ABR6N8M3_9SPHN|nr:hypothetical protein [Sphingomonas endophytica]MBB5727127.1 hypothetical protein [Sphingomonas endophytica]